MVLTAYKALQTRSLSGSFYSPISQAVLTGGLVYYRWGVSASGIDLLTPDPLFSPRIIWIT